MRAKRAKQYKKLMQQFAHLGFREPYQVLVDAELIKDVARFKMDLQAALDRTLRGKAKPMITQCSIRHLYKHVSEPGMSEVIDLAKTLERRRCGHHPEEFAEPLSTLECLKEVVDPKSNQSNKHNYVVASQSQQVRQAMREIKGVPLIYVTRSVMLMEPLSSATVQVRKTEELSKFRDGIRKTGTAQKRKREGEDEMVSRRDDVDVEATDSDADAGAEKQDDAKSVVNPSTKDSKKRKKRKYGVKGPNPLSVKRAKRPAMLKA